MQTSLGTGTGWRSSLGQQGEKYGGNAFKNISGTRRPAVKLGQRSCGGLKVENEEENRNKMSQKNKKRENKSQRKDECLR